MSRVPYGWKEWAGWGGGACPGAGWGRALVSMAGMVERLIGSSHFSRHRVSGALLVVLLVLPCVALPVALARAGGTGDGGLRLTVTVNGRGDTGRRPPDIRAGGQVVVRYRLVNHGEADLHGVRVVDPQVPAGSVRCPGRPLPAAEEFDCVARFRAAPGMHGGTVRAEGVVPSLRRRLTATARAGYSGVVPEEGSGGAGGASAGGTGAGSGGGSGGSSGGASGGGSGGGSGGAPVGGAGTATPGALGVPPPGAPGAPAAPAAPGRGAPGAGAGQPGAAPPGGDTAGADAPAAAAPGGGTTVGGAAGTGAGAGTAPAGAGAGAGAPAGAGTGTGTAAAGGPAGAPGVAAPPGLPAPPGAASAGADPPAALTPVLPVGPPGTGPGPATAGGTGVGTGISAGASAGAGVGGVDSGVRPPVVRRAAALDSEGFLGRLRRRGREASEFGVVTMLLLLLIPAALAAALLGNRRS